MAINKPFQNPNKNFAQFKPSKWQNRPFNNNNNFNRPFPQRPQSSDQYNNQATINRFQQNQPIQFSYNPIRMDTSRTTIPPRHINNTHNYHPTPMDINMHENHQNTDSGQT